MISYYKNETLTWFHLLLSYVQKVDSLLRLANVCDAFVTDVDVTCLWCRWQRSSKRSDSYDTSRRRQRPSAIPSRRRPTDRGAVPEQARRTSGKTLSCVSIWQRKV